MRTTIANESQLRTYHCPACNGAGAFWHSPSGSSNDPSTIDWDCTECDGRGRIELTDAEADEMGDLRPWSPSRRRWTGRREPMLQDSLVTLAYHRADAIKRLRLRPDTFSNELRFTTYGSVLRGAMAPKALPKALPKARTPILAAVEPILDRYMAGGYRLERAA